MSRRPFTLEDEAAWTRDLLEAVRADLADAERFGMVTLARAKREQAADLEARLSQLETA